MGKSSIQEHLVPLQMAVPIGGERIWSTLHELGFGTIAIDGIVLSYKGGVSSTFSEAHPHEVFWMLASLLTPICNKFAEHCSGEPSHLEYHERLFTSNRGQQG